MLLKRDLRQALQQRFARALAAHFRINKKILQIEPGLASPGGKVVVKESEADRLSIPLGDQAAILWRRSKAVPDEVCFCGNNSFRLALILGKTADEIQHQCCIGRRSRTDGKHDPS